MISIPAEHDIRVSKGAILLSLWVPWHLVYWYAVTYTDYQNHIHWAYTFGLFVIACIFFPTHSPIAYTFFKWVRGLGAMLFLIGLYFLAYYVVSFWELFPGTTLRWMKFDVVNVVAAVVYFIVGRSCASEQIYRAHYVLAALLVAFTVAQIAVDQDAIRYGYGWQLMLCLPAVVMLRRYWFIAFAIAVMAASQHKAALGAAIGACVIAMFFARFPKERISPARYYFRAAVRIIALIALAVFAVMLYRQIDATIERFSDTDLTREKISLLSVFLVPEFFPKGMGYMNFGEYSGFYVDIVQESRRGDLRGLTLHNAYMSWVLEGGLLVSLAVLALLWATWRRIRSIWKLDRNMASFLMAACAALLVVAAFHQVHQMMQFWGMIGLIFGYHARLHALRTNSTL